MSFPCFIGTAAFDRNIPGHALLQQKLHRLNRFFAQEAAHHDIITYGIRDRGQYHPLMVRHVGFDWYEIAPRGGPVRCEVKCVEKAVERHRAEVCERLQIFGCRHRQTAQRQR